MARDYHGSICLCSWSVILFLQLNVPILIVLDVFGILLDTSVILVGSSGLLSIRVLLFEHGFRTFWMRCCVIYDKEAAADSSKYKEDHNNKEDDTARFFLVNIWTKLISYIDVVLFTISFR